MVKHHLILRVEFRPATGEKGPVMDLVFKVFPLGSASFPGLIIGLPTLDVAPFGLGHRLSKDYHVFDGLGGVRLPRLEVEARARLRANKSQSQTVAKATSAVESEYRNVIHAFQEKKPCCDSYSDTSFASLV